MRREPQTPSRPHFITGQLIQGHWKYRDKGYKTEVWLRLRGCSQNCPWGSYS